MQPLRRILRKKFFIKSQKGFYICKNKTKPQKRRTKHKNDIVKKPFDQPKHKAETKVEQNLQSKLKKSTKSPKKLFWVVGIALNAAAGGKKIKRMAFWTKRLTGQGVFQKFIDKTVICPFFRAKILIYTKSLQNSAQKVSPKIKLH